MSRRRTSPINVTVGIGSKPLLSKKLSMPSCTLSLEIERGTVTFAVIESDVGASVGVPLGKLVGCWLGSFVGAAVGTSDGALLGAAVGTIVTKHLVSSDGSLT